MAFEEKIALDYYDTVLLCGGDRNGIRCRNLPEFIVIKDVINGKEFYGAGLICSICLPTLLRNTDDHIGLILYTKEDWGTITSGEGADYNRG